MGVEAIPALLYTLLVLSIPKSPRWLYLNNQQDEAEKIIRDAYSENEADEVATIINNLRDKLSGIDTIVGDEGNRVKQIKESRDSVEN